MTEWDPDRESYEPERDFRRDYVTPGLGYRGQADTFGRRQEDQRGVWSIGGRPREPHATRGSGGYGPGQTVRRGPSAPSGPHSGKGPRGYRRSDERIYEEVCERLARDPDVDPTDVEVSVAEGEVTLSGTVSDRAMRRLAEDVAGSCPGVRDVHNRIKVAEAAR